MCIGIPMKIVESRGLTARCEGRDGHADVDMSLVGEQPEGEWVLVFLGAAREVVSARRAGQISDALAAVELALGGAGGGEAIDALFPDLANREPELPDFLKQELKKPPQAAE